MKKILIAIPALFMLSGCITSMEAELEYRKQCKLLKEPYFNQELFNKFLEERNINIINAESTECSDDLVCSLLMQRNRWDNVKITKNNGEHRIFFRDYTLSSCKKNNIDILGPSIYTDRNRKFCIGERKINDNIEFKVKLDTGSSYLYRKDSRYVKQKYDHLYYNNEIVLERDAIIYQAPTAHDTCNSNEKIYELLLNNI